MSKRFPSGTEKETDRLKNIMKPTVEQENAIECQKSGSNFVIQARAGSGKTSLIEMLARESPRKQFLFAVFNRANADELNAREGKPSNLTGNTFHSICLREIKSNNRKFVIDKKDEKLSREIRKIEGLNPMIKTLNKDEKQLAKSDFDAMKQLVGLMKNGALAYSSYHEVIAMMYRYCITPSLAQEDFAKAALKILSACDANQDFGNWDDIIRIAGLNKMGREFICDNFVVDECQDNTLMRTIIMGDVQDIAQVGSVGDDRQAVYAWAGADSDSINNIISTLDGCKTLPLTVNFRCDKSIIRKAQELVPDINYLDSKEEGIVESIGLNDFYDKFKPGDVAIGRTNRVIIAQCFAYIKQGKPATIQGRDFGEMLKGMISSFGADSVEGFIDCLDKWFKAIVEKSDDYTASDAITDRYECLKFLALGCSTIIEIENKIDKIFSNTQSQSMYKFSSAHKSKGLEWDNVFILEHDNFMSTNPKTPKHVLEQEPNLLYIAYTRARKSLYLVESNQPKVVTIEEKRFKKQEKKVEEPSPAPKVIEAKAEEPVKAEKSFSYSHSRRNEDIPTEVSAEDDDGPEIKAYSHSRRKEDVPASVSAEDDDQDEDDGVKIINPDL